MRPFISLAISSMKKIVVNRSSITGEFVTEQFAKKHPKTTEKETYKRK